MASEVMDIMLKIGVTENVLNTRQFSSLASKCRAACGDFRPSY
jgi:hypothetical protein